MLVCTLGDLLLDVIVRLEQPLAEGDDAVAVSRVWPGGQAANVAAWAADLGAGARFVGKRARDPVGALLVSSLEARGVAMLGPAVDGRTGVVVSMVGPDGDRSMASDRGVAPELAPAELDPAWFSGCDWLHVAGYSLVRDPIATAAERAAELARAAGARVSVDLSSWNAIRAFGVARVRDRLERLSPAIVFATERERATLGWDPPRATWVVKRGPAGFEVDGEAFDAASAQVVDTTGAGDALAAGYLVGGPELARETAARCIAGLGAMP
jgi:sugar/nucleoside kinase (ribokinase family)